MASWNLAAHCLSVVMVSPEFGSASILLCILNPVETSPVKQQSPLFHEDFAAFRGANGDFLFIFPNNIGLYDRNTDRLHDN